MTDQAVNIPNLFLIGAMKSATTSLHSYLDKHPNIFMSKRPWKEPQFFAKEENWHKGFDWYYSLFKDASQEKYIGESSTTYSRLPNIAGVAERIHEVSPCAKIIYIMRDPIERAISHYWWEVESSGEGRKMVQAIINSDWIMSVSYYALQIKPYLELFGKQNVYTLTTEELQNSPIETMKKIFAWLDLDTEVNLEQETYKVFNPSKEKVNRLIGSGYISHLKGTLFWKILKTLVPPNTSFRRRVRKLLSKPVEKTDEGQEETIALLRPIMLPQVEELSELLGRDFPEWKTVYEKNTS